MQRITVALTPEAYDNLKRRARRERRSVSAQAGLLLEAQVLAQPPAPPPALDPPPQPETAHSALPDLQGAP